MKAASKATSDTKKRVGHRDTRPELALRRLLWKCGYRYRSNYKALPGRPDIVFLKSKLVVFVDGDYWHGRNWPARRKKLALGSNGKYWMAKIEANMARDLSQKETLERLGWKVLRLWETDILRDPSSALAAVEDALNTSAP